MADGVWKGVLPYGFGSSKQLSQNNYFDPSTPSMGKGCNGGKNTSLAAKGALAHRLQCLQNPKFLPGGPKWPTGSGKVTTPRFLGVLSNFR